MEMEVLSVLNATAIPEELRTWLFSVLVKPLNMTVSTL
jgi:hypothetical protein